MAASIPAHASRTEVQNPYSARPNWVYPTVVFVSFAAFILYATYVVLFETSGRFHSYLSPFFSPDIGLVKLGPITVPPAIWVAWAPLAFRLTCYYYRKAYGRGFLWHPRACAVPEPSRGRYEGETRFWIFNNLHRFALYAILVQTLFLWYDVFAAFVWNGAPHLGIGNLIMVVNVICLTGYTLGCHALRNLVGGGVDCFSCHQTRYKLWKGVTVLNVRHEFWAWISMFTVWGTDVYIRLGVHGFLGNSGWL